MIGFRHLMRSIAPAWLDRKWGERFLYGHSVILDGIAEWALQGLKARFPDKAPADALPYIGRDRVIIRGFAESQASYQIRLKSWLDLHKRRGSALALLENIHGYFTPYSAEMRFATVDHGGTWWILNGDKTWEKFPKEASWDWDSEIEDSADWWSRAAVIIWPLDSGAFTDADEWEADQTWGDPGCFGLSFATAVARDLIDLVQYWKPAGTRCLDIIACLDENELLPGTSPLPDGWWGTPAKVVGGVWVPTRPDFARFIGRVGEA